MSFQYKVDFTPQALEDISKLDKAIAERITNKIEWLSRNPFDRRLRTHKLTGKLEGLWAFSAGYDCRVLFKFLGKDEALLV